MQHLGALSKAIVIEQGVATKYTTIGTTASVPLSRAHKMTAIICILPVLYFYNPLVKSVIKAKKNIQIFH